MSMSKRDKKALWINKHIIKSHRKYYVFERVNNKVYCAEYHRAQYWFDREDITPQRTKQLKNTWHIMYWECFDGGGRVALWTGGNLSDIFFGNKEEIKKFLKSELIVQANRWEKLKSENP